MRRPALLGFASDDFMADLAASLATRPGDVEAFLAKPETFARTMRQIHDGTGMPLLWQMIIFVGGILPALLALTGILMWLRMRRRRERHRTSMAALAEADALAN